MAGATGSAFQLPDLANAALLLWLVVATSLAIVYRLDRGRVRYYVHVETGWILKTRGDEDELDAIEHALAPDKYRRCDAMKYERQQWDRRKA